MAPGGARDPRHRGPGSLGCVCSPDSSLGLPFSGVARSEPCPFSAPCCGSQWGRCYARGCECRCREAELGRGQEPEAFSP